MAHVFAGGLWAGRAALTPWVRARVRDATFQKVVWDEWVNINRFWEDGGGKVGDYEIFDEAIVDIDVGVDIRDDVSIFFFLIKKICKIYACINLM